MKMQKINQIKAKHQEEFRKSKTQALGWKKLSLKYTLGKSPLDEYL